MSKVRLNNTCPKCGAQYQSEAEIPDAVAPTVRSKLVPNQTILVYRITSEDIKNFITAKARAYCPEAKVEVVTKYYEKKATRNTTDGLHHSYASLRVALSDDVIDNETKYGWYEKLGQADGNIRFKSSIFTRLIKKYDYNPDQVDKWLKDYRTLERLHNDLGITEDDIKEIRYYATPRKKALKDGTEFIMFAAAAENVIADMLEDPETNKVIGRIQIADVNKIESDVVEFLTYVHPQEIEYQENPHVREILLGNKEK